MSDPAAFMSYAQFDDQHDGGYLTRFRSRLSDEVRMQSGQQFEIFQDKDSIEWGQNWRVRINDTLDAVTFLIPIMTPNFFTSRGCRDEVERFLEREKHLGRNNLVLPIYYVRAEVLEDTSLRGNDPIAEALYEHQYVDWRQLRHKSIETQLIQKKIESLASRLASSVTRNLVDKKGPLPAQGLQGGTSRDEHAPSAPANVLVPDVVPLIDDAGRPRRIKKAGRKNVETVWTALSAELERVTFQPMDQTILAVRTEAVRSALAQDFPSHPLRASEIWLIIDALRHTLESALASNANSADVESRCELAERLRKILIGLLTK